MINDNTLDRLSTIVTALSYTYLHLEDSREEIMLVVNEIFNEKDFLELVDELKEAENG